jgi:hypothetical protein
MSGSTSDTSAIDDKKEESKTIPNDYVTNMTSFLSSIILFFIVFIIYFSSSSLILYGCKLAQSNILPTESNCYPYTEEKPNIKPINTNIFTTFFEPQMSMKMNFPYDEFNSSNKLLDMLREYRNESKSHFLANYFISIIESLVQFNYSAFNSILNALNGLPEILMVLFGPIIFGIVSALVLLCDNLYLIYLWFANMGWFFKSNTNYSASGGPNWTDTTWLGTPINFWIAVWFVIIFAIGFLFTMPVFFFLSFLLMLWTIFTSITYKSEMNGKKTTAGTIIQDVFKYYKVPFMGIFSLFIIISSFSKLGAASGIFSIITLILIYFGIISIDTFNPVNNDNMSPITSFDQAKKTCSFKPQSTNSKQGFLYNLIKGGGNISKEIKNASKILSRK